MITVKRKVVDPSGRPGDEYSTYDTEFKYTLWAGLVISIAGIISAVVPGSSLATTLLILMTMIVPFAAAMYFGCHVIAIYLLLLLTDARPRKVLQERRRRLVTAVIAATLWLLFLQVIKYIS